MEYDTIRTACEAKKITKWSCIYNSLKGLFFSNNRKNNVNYLKTILFNNIFRYLRRRRIVRVNLLRHSTASENITPSSAYRLRYVLTYYKRDAKINEEKKINLK